MTPEDWVTNIATRGIFEFSTIYNFGLKQLLEGHFAQNLGRFLHLNSWASLLPFLGVILGMTLLFFWNEIKRDHAAPVMRTK